MRTGPHPLSVHLGMAASSWPVMSQATDIKLIEEMSGGMAAMLRGIRLYQEHPYKPEQDPLPLVWKKGSVTVRRCAATKKPAGMPMMLIPSLINRSDIMDLCAERSLARWLGAQGHTVYVLDWGDVAGDVAQNDIDTMVLKRLVPAIRDISEKEGRSIGALGYCMGGTLLVAAAAQKNMPLEKIILLAAPWDFHAGTHALLDRLKFWAPSAMTYIQGGLPLPVEGIQTLFASLDPAMAARKFAAFADMDQGSDEAKLFVATEDWLNNGAALPANVAQHCIQEWFFDNRPARGEWLVGGRSIKPQDIHIPALIISSRRDKLVEYESATALNIPGAHIHNPDCGHIGMVAGKHSIEKVWQPLAAWLKN